MPTKGRLQVAPRQTIASADWGNPLWDQSVQCFDSAADRANQYPTPHPGSLSYRADLAVVEVFRNGRWEGNVGTLPVTFGTPLVAKVPYVAQPTRIVGGLQPVNTNGTAYAVLLASASVAGGILTAGLHGTSTFLIGAAWNTSGQQLGVILWNGGTLAASVSVSVSWWALIY